jgi:hypothetical protein
VYISFSSSEKAKEIRPNYLSSCSGCGRNSINSSKDFIEVPLHDIDNDSECWEVDLASSRMALVFGNLFNDVFHVEV